MLFIVLLSACSTGRGSRSEALPPASRWVQQDRRLVLVDRVRGLVIAEPGSIPDHLRKPLSAALGGTIPAINRVQGVGATENHPGVALFQAGAWRLAEAWFNGALTDGEYALQFDALVQRCAGLMGAPLPSKPGKDPRSRKPQECEGTCSPTGKPRPGLQWTDRGFIL